MRWTRAELDGWRGREAIDADAQAAGEVVTTFVDDQTGAPRWLAVRTGAHGDDLTPVPIDDAEPTGAAIRLGHPIATIHAAPHVTPGPGHLSPEQDRQLCVFYGLQPPPPPTPHPAGGGPGVDEGVVAALRGAHALEREALSRLQSLLSALDDTELQHDVARHLTETEGHAAAIAGRLEQLEKGPSSVRDMLGIASTVVPPRGGPAELLRDALEFERRECETYAQLIATAREAGDEASAAIAQKIRDDEEAMAETIASSLRRMGVSS